MPRYGRIPTKLVLVSNGTLTALHRVHRWRFDDGFDYSEAIKAKGGTWIFDDLDQFPTDPRAYASDTKTTYAGETDPTKRADLPTLSDNPEPLPAK